MGIVGRYVPTYFGRQGLPGPLGPLGPLGRLGRQGLGPPEPLGLGGDRPQTGSGGTAMREGVVVWSNKKK